MPAILLLPPPIFLDDAASLNSEYVSFELDESLTCIFNSVFMEHFKNFQKPFGKGNMSENF